MPRSSVDAISNLVAIGLERARAQAAENRAEAARQNEQLKSTLLDVIAHEFKTPLTAIEAAITSVTPKEFDLLLYLASNPNATVSHTKLLQAVWGPDYGDQVEYLRTFMNQLRKKIEVDPAHPTHIITEPWVGYRLQAPENE